MRGFRGMVTSGGCGEAPAAGAAAPPMTVAPRAEAFAPTIPSRRRLGGGGGSGSGTTSSPVNSGNSGSVHSRVSRALSCSRRFPSAWVSARIDPFAIHIRLRQEVGAIWDPVPAFFDVLGKRQSAAERGRPTARAAHHVRIAPPDRSWACDRTTSASYLALHQRRCGPVRKTLWPRFHRLVKSVCKTSPLVERPRANIS